jgi:hypothetical protein
VFPMRSVQIEGRDMDTFYYLIIIVAIFALIFLLPFIVLWGLFIAGAVALFGPLLLGAILGLYVVYNGGGLAIALLVAVAIPAFLYRSWWRNASERPTVAWKRGESDTLAAGLTEAARRKEIAAEKWRANWKKGPRKQRSA